jgi:hypothetical protein
MNSGPISSAAAGSAVTREGWERAPYWLDGLVPLAFLLDDPVLKDKVHRYVGLYPRAPARGWLAGAATDGRGRRPGRPAALRPVGAVAGAEGAGAVPRCHGRCARDRRAGALPCAASTGTSTARRSSTGASSAGSRR